MLEIYHDDNWWVHNKVQKTNHFNDEWFMEWWFEHHHQQAVPKSMNTHTGNRVKMKRMKYWFTDSHNFAINKDGAYPPQLLNDIRRKYGVI